MNWLDIALIIGLIGGAFMGLRIGLIRAGFIGAGITVGFLIVGQTADDLAGWLGKYTTNESLATVFGYDAPITVAVCGDCSVMTICSQRSRGTGAMPTWARNASQC